MKLLLLYFLNIYTWIFEIKDGYQRLNYETKPTQLGWIAIDIKTVILTCQTQNSVY